MARWNAADSIERCLMSRYANFPPTYVPRYYRPFRAPLTVATHVLYRGAQMLDLFLLSDERWEEAVTYVREALAEKEESPGSVAKPIQID